jgi:hypothetical protein
LSPPHYTWSENEWLVTQGYQRHLMQVAFVDTLLGQLLAKLEREGLLDETLLVVTSDHGSGFRPGGPLRNVDVAQFAAIMSVPLFIKGPWQPAGRIDDRNVETIDIVPTVAEMLDGHVPWRVDGTSALGSTFRTTKEFSYDRVEVTRSFDPGAVQRGVREIAAHKRELFGNAGGPFRVPLAAPHPELLRQPLAAIPTEALAPGVTVEIDDADAFARVDVDAEYVPARIAGTATWSGTASRLALAIGINGKVCATTLTAGPPESAEWSAMIPPSCLQTGRNQIRVDVISESEVRVRLARAAGGP